MNPKVKWYEILCRVYGIDPADPAWSQWAAAEWSAYLGCTFSQFKRAFERRYEGAKFAAEFLGRRGPSA